MDIHITNKTNKFLETFICFHDCRFHEVLSNGMNSALIGNQRHNIVRHGESGSSVEFDEEFFQF